jgi:hypothetical protein
MATAPLASDVGAQGSVGDVEVASPPVIDVDPIRAMPGGMDEDLAGDDAMGD